MKRNYVTMAFYCLIIVILTMAVYFYQQPFLLALLLPLIIIPMISVPIFVKRCKDVTINFYSDSPYVEKGNAVPIRLVAENPTLYPFMRTEATFTLRNQYFKETKIRKIAIALSPKHTEKLLIPIENGSIGMITFGLKYVELYEMLGFLKYKIDINKDVNVPVLPGTRTISELVPAPSYEGEEECIENTNKGMVSADIKEIREYHEGDRLQRIHWKLSSKLDDLFVKEPENTAVLSIVLLPEFTKDKIEDTVSTLLSIINLLNKQEDRFEICIFNNTTYDFSFVMSTDEESLLNLFIILYFQPLYEGETVALDAYVNSGQKKASVIHVVGDKYEILED